MQFPQQSVHNATSSEPRSASTTAHAQRKDPHVRKGPAQQLRQHRGVDLVALPPGLRRAATGPAPRDSADATA